MINIDKATSRRLLSCQRTKDIAHCDYLLIILKYWLTHESLSFNMMVNYGIM